VAKQMKKTEAAVEMKTQSAKPAANPRLQELVKKLAETRKTAAIELESVEHRYRIGAATAKFEAQQELGRLEEAYKAEVRNNVVKVLFLGSPERCAQALKESGVGQGAVVVEADAVYRYLARKVSVTLDARSRHFGTTQFARLVEEMADVGRDFELRDMAMPYLDANLMGAPVATEQALVDLIRTAVRAGAKDDLVVMMAERTALDAVLAGAIDTRIVPVLVTNVTQEEGVGLSGGLFGTRPFIAIDVEELADGELGEAVRARIREGLAAIG
jgi:hypothetical protein